jgi:hypothetical protein
LPSVVAVVEPAALVIVQLTQADVGAVELGIQAIKLQAELERNQVNRAGAVYTDLAIQETQQAATAEAVAALAALVAHFIKTVITVV